MLIYELLIEMPELRNWVLDKTKKQDTDHSYRSFKSTDRLYDFIESDMVVKGDRLFIAISKKKYNCDILIKRKKPGVDQLGFRCISSISFHHPILSNIPSDLKNPLQISDVYTHSEFEGYGIASYAYACLAREGYTIISDKVQYLGGKMLWKRIAELAKLNNYTVSIYNEDLGYLKDSNGNIIKYDSSNIQDSIIWKHTTIGQKTLLILQSNEHN